MEPLAFRTLLTVLFFSILSPFSQADNFYDREDIQARLETMDCIVQPRYTNSVESYIKGYLSNDARKAKIILERTAVYFPIFEEYLEEHQMPEDLKYLAVVESGLNPKAVSRVGAVGLWQFMKETGGKDYGLRINSRIDERSCPHASTEAAMKYLSRAYDRFGSWELALASYNCGAGNVNRAIRRAGGEKDYWAISKYLPRETRNFVPAFLGAAYIVKYHQTHGVLPEYPNLDLQVTEGIKVYTQLSFETIAAVAGIPVEVVEKLNPHYKREYVPAYAKGHYVVLPRRVGQTLKDYLHLLRPDAGSASEMPELPELVNADFYFPQDQYYETFYTVTMGDDLKKLGDIFSCTGYNLKVWNELPNHDLKRGQELTVWFPKELKRFRPENGQVNVLPIIKRAPTPVKAETLPMVAKIRPIEPLAITPLSIPPRPAPHARVRSTVYFDARKAAEGPTKIQKVKLWAKKKGILK